MIDHEGLIYANTPQIKTWLVLYSRREPIVKLLIPMCTCCPCPEPNISWSGQREAVICRALSVAAVFSRAWLLWLPGQTVQLSAWAQGMLYQVSHLFSNLIPCALLALLCFPRSCPPEGPQAGRWKSLFTQQSGEQGECAGFWHFFPFPHWLHVLSLENCWTRA